MISAFGVEHGDEVTKSWAGNLGARVGNAATKAGKVNTRQANMNAAAKGGMSRGNNLRHSMGMSLKRVGGGINQSAARQQATGYGVAAGGAGLATGGATSAFNRSKRKKQ